MTKDELKILIIGGIGGLGIIIESVFVLTGENRAKNDVYASPTTEISEMVVEEETMVNEAELSLMPCVATSEFAEWYETYSEAESESEASEEVREETSTECVESETELESESTYVETTEAYTEPETVATTAETEAVRTIWYVNGEQIDQGITDALYDALNRHGLSEWMPGALAQVYQESHAQRYAVSNDGMDHGILQYRAMYWGTTSAQYGWGGADIYDIYAQFDIYAQQMANRFGSGMSIPDAVSRHKTSDFGGYDDVYWNQVSQWMPTVEVR